MKKGTKKFLTSAFILLNILVFSLSLFTSGIVSAASGNWIEVTRFGDDGPYFQTDPFTIYHVEWRIRWEYEPHPEVPDEHPSLHVYVYAQESPGTWFESVRKNGTEETSGTLYIHDRNGTFHLMIISAVQSYTVIVEQNLESIPELPSWTPILVTLFAVAVAAVIYKRKLQANNSERDLF